MAAKISFFVSGKRKVPVPQALLRESVEVVEERRPRGRHSTYCRHMYASWPGKTLPFPRRKLQDIRVAPHAAGAEAAQISGSN